MEENTEGTKQERIDWRNFEGEFVTFEEDKRRRITITNPREEKGEYQGKETNNLVFDVLELDGKKYPQGKKFLNTSSKRLIVKLKPIAIGLEEKPGCVTVEIKRIGDKFKTQYDVEVVGK